MSVKILKLILKVNVFGSFVLIVFGLSNNDRIWNGLIASQHSSFQKSIVRSY